MVSLPTSMAGVPGSATRGATPEQQYPQGVYTNWGDAACLHGVAKTPEGLAFGSKIGIWFSHFGGLNATYGADPSQGSYNYLTGWSYTNHGWLDGANFNTQFVPAPTALAVLAAAGLVGRRRR